MSDYTPDGMSDSEPSMEDILASIRKIIADDSAKPQAEEPEPTALSVADSALPDADDDVLDLADGEFSEFVAGDLTADGSDANVDDDILDLTENLIAENDDLVVAGDDGFDSDFDLVLDDDDSDDTIALKAGAAVAAVSAGAAGAGLLTADDAPDVSGFDDAEFDLDIPAEAEQVIDPAADLLTEDDDGDLMSVLMARADRDTAPLGVDDSSVSVAGADEPLVDAADIAPAAAEIAGTSATSGDADIDLVKSLMAELTEDDESFVELDASGEDAVSVDSAPAASDDGEDETDFDFGELLTGDDDAADGSDVTGISATVEDSPQPEDFSDDLASIVAQSSADIEAAKSDALAISDDDDTFDLAALIEDGEADDGFEAIDAEDAPKTAVIGAAIAGASVLGASAAALSKTEETSDDATPDEDIIAEIDAASDDAHDFDASESAEPKIDPETQITAPADTAATQTPKEDEDMPHIVKDTAIATDETVEAASGAFASLSQVVEEKAVYNESGPRIGDLVQEALKPMLQEWLDKNLKGIVDRAVAKEIKRISSGK